MAATSSEGFILKIPIHAGKENTSPVHYSQKGILQMHFKRFSRITHLL